MDRNTYLKYISHFVHKVDTLSIDAEYKSFFSKHLGKEMMNASDEKLKDVAFHLYKAYILSNIIKIRALDLAKTLSDKQLTDMINAEIALLEKNKLEFSLSSDLTSKAINSAIKSQGSSSTVASLKDFLSGPKKTTKAKKSPAVKKPRAKKSSATKKTRATAVKKPPAKKAGQKLADCKEKYTVPELKALAKSLGVTGYSRMGKEELCKAIKYQ